MSPLSWILVIIGGLCAVVIFAWLMAMSLNQRNHRDDWP